MFGWGGNILKPLLLVTQTKIAPWILSGGSTASSTD